MQPWDTLGDWLTQWLTADSVERDRLREKLALEHPAIVVEADALTAASGRMAAGFLETPALALAAKELSAEDAVFAAGAMAGPYRILSFLARGGMGDVYRATDVRLHRDVALKFLAQARTSDPNRVDRFMYEARMTASLDHPNIVRVYDVGRLDDRAYLVAELLDGETVRARISRGAMPVADVRRIGIEIARGLVAAHAAGLVHRDLKPENIFLTRGGTTKLLDFGIAKLTQDETTPDAGRPETMTGVVVGTAGYLSPEQIRAEPVDGRADLFALGTVLFEMLTGSRPFGRAHIVDTLHAILHDAPSNALAERTDVPPAFITIVVRLLEKTPEARYQQANEVIEALEAMDAGSRDGRRAGLAVDPDSRIGRRQSARTRRRLITWTPIAVALIALAALLPAPFLRPAESPPGSAPEMTLAIVPFRTLHASPARGPPRTGPGGGLRQPSRSASRHSRPSAQRHQAAAHPRRP